MNEWVSKTLGKVRIDSLLARGGMAEVYFGVHTTLQRDVAVKILRNQYEDDPELLQRFEREAQVVAKLRHQNIVQVFDYDTVDDHPYIVMEFVSGPSLSKYLTVLHQKSRHLEFPEISRIITGVANALQYAHKSGVVHRDIKPGNIILTSASTPVIPGEPLPHDFEPVLTDFGLVRFLNSSRQTSAGQTAGTPAYMSPEQARGEATDGRTDIYSLGIVLYEMLTGKVPFDGETTMSILLKHITEPPLPVQGLAYPIQQVLDRALAKNVADRFQTPNEFAKAFNAVSTATAAAIAGPGTFIGITPITADIVPSVTAEPDQSLVIVNVPQKARRRWTPILLGAVALTVLGTFYFASAFSTPPAIETPTTAPTVTHTQRPVISFTDTSGRLAVLHIRDGDAIMDQAVLEALAMPAPPAGCDYEVWLAGPSGRVSIGILILDGAGKGTRTFNASQGENLLLLYDTVEISIKPGAAADPAETERIAYSYTLPGDGLFYVRQMLVAHPNTPDQSALLQSLATDSKELEQAARNMLNSFLISNLENVKFQAESLSNILVGDQNPAHKDRNNDGTTTDPSDGFGFLTYGDKLGHIEALYTQANFAANSLAASQNMIVHGAEVKACAENLVQWTAQLKELAETILAADSLAEVEGPVKDAAAVADQIYNGIDMDDNGDVDPIVGECGVLTAYSSAYAMADMPLFPTTLSGTATAGLGTPSPGATISSAAPTKGSGGSGGSGNTAVPPKPTKKTNPGGGGGNGGGNGGGGGGNGNGGNP